MQLYASAIILRRRRSAFRDRYAFWSSTAACCRVMSAACTRGDFLGGDGRMPSRMASALLLGVNSRSSEPNRYGFDQDTSPVTLLK